MSDSADPLRRTREVLTRFGVSSRTARWTATAAGLRAIYDAPFKELKGIVKSTDTLVDISRALGKSDAYVHAYRLVLAVDDVERDGHTCVAMVDLRKRTSGILSVAAFDSGLAMAQRLDELLLEDDFVYKTSTWAQERSIVKEILRLARDFGPRGRSRLARLLDAVHADATMDDFGLTPQQSDAVRMVFGNPVSVLTGFAGTGKTTTVKCIKTIADRMGYVTRLAAPTGAAAKRIRELFDPCAACSGSGSSNGADTSCTCACTVHKLLDAAVDKSGRFLFRRHRGNPISAHLVVVDESSMLDLALTARLLLALPVGARIVFIGDPCQLPSVMAGKVLKDMAACLPHVALTQVMRQARDSDILAFAHRVRAGGLATGGTPVARDFSWEPLEDVGDIIQRVHELVEEWRGEDEDGSEGCSFQVLCPARRPGAHGLSTTDLNPLLQRTVNRANREAHHKTAAAAKRKPCRMVPGDRVMYTKNADGLLNGDTGHVTQVVWVPGKGRWDVEVQYEASLRWHDGADVNLDLAWAVTVHKSQGNQYDRVLLVMHPGHARLLSRELLYTAVTRAKSRLVMLAAERCVSACVATGVERFTRLGESLHACVSPLFFE